MIKKVEMELATITIGRYSTPYLLRKVVSAKLVKTMLELRMRKKGQKIGIESFIQFLPLGLRS